MIQELFFVSWYTINFIFFLLEHSEQKSRVGLMEFEAFFYCADMQKIKL